MTDATSAAARDKFIVRLPDGLRDQLAAAAAANKRSMNSEVVALIEAGLSHGLREASNRSETEQQRFDRAFMLVAKALLTRESYGIVLRHTEGIIRASAAEIVPQLAERVGFEPTVR